VPYGLDNDFTLIAMISDTPMLLVAGPNKPYSTVQELVAAAKKYPAKIALSWLGAIAASASRKRGSGLNPVRN